MKLPMLTAFALFAGSASSASAAILSFIDEDIAIPTNFIGVSVNLETGAFNAIDEDGLPEADVNFIFGGEWITNDADQAGTAPSWQPVRDGTENSSTIVNLGLGAVVGPASDYSTGYGGSTDQITPTQFTSGEKGYIGFSMEVAGTSPVYGWMEVTLQDDNTPGVIHSWAYEDNGSSFAVGSLIPEPSHSMLIALGLLVTALRRRR
ncbi:PEP-CTERM sorting domain-containing protein [Akkermansiaceae bacterium]|nr:PEP-CTERM sorting domain-containing protein [Akkermansiaceae bacterium]MDB4624077.1 PEP-CTERM sorting domain-containing protein [Akkermansiaceae bacterium]